MPPDNTDVTEAIADLIAQPKRARTDAGEVEMQDLDKAVDAAKFVVSARQSQSPASPFACLRKARITFPGGTGE